MFRWQHASAVAILAIVMGSICSGAAQGPLGAAVAGETLTIHQAGERLRLGPHTVTVKEYDVTHVIRNQFGEPFRFDCHGGEGLRLLREREHLEDVVAAGRTEFDKQVLLLDWTYKRFPLFGPPGARAHGALEILSAVDEGKAFNCSYFARVMREAASSMGWVVRSIGLKGAESDGNGSEHAILEIWSNEYRKWIAFDPTLNIYFESDNIPLNAFEIRQLWFYNEGRDLTIVIGAARERYRVDELPIVRAYHRGFGNLAINRRSLGKFLYIAYSPTAVSGDPDYAKMFITRDKLNEGVPYHDRPCPDDPARDPYWPMCQVDLAFSLVHGLKLKVTVDTWTPDFAGHRWRIDGDPWQEGAPAEWVLHGGGNSLEVIPSNKFGVDGVPSRVALEVELGQQ